MVKKGCAVRVNSRVLLFHPVYMSAVKRFLSHMTVCVVTCCFAVLFGDAIRSDVAFIFVFCLLLVFPHGSGVDQGITLC